MVNHEIYIKPGDTLTVRVAPADPRSTTAGDNESDNNNYARVNLSAVGGKRNTTRKASGGKRALSGYMKFCNKMRPELLKANPGMEFAKVGKHLGEKWRALSEAEKKRY